MIWSLLHPPPWTGSAPVSVPKDHPGYALRFLLRLGNDAPVTSQPSALGTRLMQQGSHTLGPSDRQGCDIMGKDHLIAVVYMCFLLSRRMKARESPFPTDKFLDPCLRPPAPWAH